MMELVKPPNIRLFRRLATKTKMKIGTIFSDANAVNCLSSAALVSLNIHTMFLVSHIEKHD